MQSDTTKTAIKYMMGIMLGLACVLVMLSIFSQNAVKKRAPESDKTENKTDSVYKYFANTVHDADSVLSGYNNLYSDSLRRNNTYQDMTARIHNIDSLQRVNDSLIASAYKIVRQHSIMTIAHPDARIFENTQYRPIYKMASEYYNNQSKIDSARQMILPKQNLEKSIRRHFDSITIAKLNQVIEMQKNLIANKQITDKNRER